ncbi:hypothetical protein ACFQY7_36380 [Actinomadura luteofluorescens]|uniref:hypothetical protein n=1 Tax=Actinomadura luteofluorescens TaxID=46163 RepID=UPI00362F95E8
MEPRARAGQRAPGTGRFLVKVGGQPGIPFKVELTSVERDVNDTNKRWTNSTTRPPAGAI